VDKGSGTSTGAGGAGGGAGGGAVSAATTTVTSGPTGTTSTTSATSSSTGGDPPGPDEAVAFQINPGHSGSVENDSLTPPLTLRWSRDLGAQVSYPLIAGGRVFVTTGSGNSTAKLVALEQKTGKTVWGPIELGGSSPASYAAYEGGKVFTVNYDGEVRAFEADTGTELWSMHLPSMGRFDSALTALGGKIYITGGGGSDAIFAVSEATGALLWKRSQQATDYWNQPAASAAGAYFACECAAVCGVEGMAGGDLWAPSQDCVGNGRGGTLLSEGRLYVFADIGLPAEKGPVFDAATGGKVGTFHQDVGAFHKGRGFFFSYASGSPSSTLLTARSVPGMVPLWSFAGDGSLSTMPIVVNGHVYIGEASGTVAAVDEITGVPVWSQNLGLGESINDSSNWQDAPRMGLAAGGGALLVPAHQYLVALW
jgi:outer membrane protein assembly factor BamB